MGLRVLIVEDDDERMLTFDAVFRDDTAFRACDADGAIALLGMGGYDLVMLDHDLGPGGNGQDVARVIASLPADQQPFVIIHSWNPDGARRMADILIGGGVAVGRQMFGADIGVTVRSFRRRALATPEPA